MPPNLVVHMIYSQIATFVCTRISKKGLVLEYPNKAMHKLTPLRHLLTFTPNNSRVFAIIKDTRRTKIFKWVERDSPELKKYLENYPYPEHYKPSFVEYNGPETLRVAYVLDRNPICTPETHPVQQDMQNLMIENGNYYARHEYTSFTEYWPAWKEAKKKLQVCLFFKLT